MNRLAIPRAGRPEKARVIRVSCSRAEKIACLYASGMPGFIACQKGSAHLDRTGSQSDAGHDSAAIHDSSGGDHRNLNGVHDLRDQCHRANHAGSEITCKSATVTPGLASLRHHRVYARLLEHEGSFTVVAVPAINNPRPRISRMAVSGKRPKVKLNAEAPVCNVAPSRSSNEICSGAGRDGAGKDCRFGEKRGNSLQCSLRVIAGATWGKRREQVNAEWPRGLSPNFFSRFEDSLRCQIGSADEAHASRLAYCRNQLRCIAPARQWGLDYGH